jgi:hypothetical protein
MQYVSTVLTIDNSCLTEGCFKQKRHKVLPNYGACNTKHLAETQSIYVINKHCAFDRCD